MIGLEFGPWVTNKNNVLGTTSVLVAHWQTCVDRLKSELPFQQYNTWIRPLQAENGVGELRLVAPNRFVLDWVKDKFLDLIRTQLREVCGDASVDVVLDVASQGGYRDADAVKPVDSARVFPQGSPSLGRLAHQVRSEAVAAAVPGRLTPHSVAPAVGVTPAVVRSPDTIVEGKLRHRGKLNADSTFDNFVEGKSNQLARAAAMQVADNPGQAYNPLFIYGGVGLGKTHLMHAVGNALLARKPKAKIVYLHSETFVATMVTALQLNAINEFKRYYRSVDALLIDDIQFFAGKERSQEEFFHTFNALLEGGQQIILTSDRFHKELTGVEERLKSRFGWGLTVAVEPPELETRAAILINKAAQSNVPLSNEAAFFIAQRVRSNVRELEGALKRVIAHANFGGRPIDVPLIRDALKDLFAVQDKMVSIDNIQRCVAEYYGIKMSDLLSKRRSRSVARPRQVAMSLAKELTNHSLPEIGDGFGGRDHTTVLHACRQIANLRRSSTDIEEDYNNLLRTLSS